MTYIIIEYKTEVNKKNEIIKLIAIHPRPIGRGFLVCDLVKSRRKLLRVKFRERVIWLNLPPAKVYVVKININ